MDTNILCEKDIVFDSIASQKLIGSTYNTFTNECVNPKIRNDFINIMKEEHDIQYDLFTEAQKRGWYQVQQADQNQVNQVKQKYGQ